MTDPYPFLHDAPEGFEPTMELRWFQKELSAEEKMLRMFEAAPFDLVLCQKWTGAFMDCWVRVPIEMP